MRTATSILSVSFVLGLVPALASAGEPVLPEPVSQPQQELFVFANGVVCITAPCPSFTVVTPDGASLPVADVVLPAGTDEQAQTALFNGGLVVEGVVEQGLWAPGGTGTVVRATAIVDEAQDFLVFRNGIVCIMAPCPSFTAVSADGQATQISGLDLEAFAHDPDLFTQVLGGEIVVKGFIKRGTWAPLQNGDVLVVSKIAGATQEFQVQSSGIVCVVAPCPVWSVTNAAGVEQKAARVDLTALRLLGEEAEAEVLATLHAGATVRGFLSAGPWSPFATGDVLFVTEIVE